MRLDEYTCQPLSQKRDLMWRVTRAVYKRDQRKYILTFLPEHEGHVKFPGTRELGK